MNTLKFVGTAMIMAGGIGAGLTLSFKNRNHLHTVEAVERMFAETKLMLQYNAVTFSELVGYLKKSSQTKELKFLNIDAASISVREEVIKAVKENKDNLSDEEKFQLEAFFSHLGQTDLEGQIALAKRYGEFFREDLKKLRDESRVKCRLYNSLGALGGAFIAILLI